MSRFRDFDAARAERAREPLEFKLGGEMFTAMGDIPAGLLLDTAAGVTGDAASQASVFQALFEGIVVAEDHERFAAAVRRVDMQTVLELVEWIMQEVTGRPLPNAFSSPPVPSPDGFRWTADSPSLDSTRSP